MPLFFSKAFCVPGDALGVKIEAVLLQNSQPTQKVGWSMSVGTLFAVYIG